MGEDFEVEDSCPKCGSTNVDTRWDDFGLVRLFLHCKKCFHIEAQNECPEATCDTEEMQPWQENPDAWKA